MIVNEAITYHCGIFEFGMIRGLVVNGVKIDCSNDPFSNQEKKH